MGLPPVAFSSLIWERRAMFSPMSRRFSRSSSSSRARSCPASLALSGPMSLRSRVVGGGCALLQHFIRRRWRRIGHLRSPGLTRLVRRPLAALAIGADALFNWGDFPSCFPVRTNSADRLVVCLDHLADLSIGLARIGFEQLADQVA